MKILLSITTLILCLLQGIHLKAQYAGNALHFDGTNDYVTMALPGAFNNLQSNSITVETWIYPESFSFYRIFFAQTSNTNLITLTTAADSNLFGFVVANGITYSCSTNINTLVRNQWSHVAITWDAVNKAVNLYINGNSMSLSSGGNTSTGIDNVFTIGSRNDGSQFFHGAMDEFKVWSYKKSACEIYNSMNKTHQGSESGLVAYYDFNTGIPGGSNPSNTRLLDLVGNFNGNLTNFALSGSTSNWMASSATITDQLNLVSTFSETICKGDTFVFDGMPYYDAGNHIRTFVTSKGCDSMAILNLKINDINTTITKTGNILFSNQPGATYQWLDCDNSNAPIAGATAQTFIANRDGNYAVQISYEGCSATSACTNDVLSINTFFNNKTTISPNPGNGLYTINSENGLENIQFELYDVTGKKVWSQTHVTGNQLTINITEMGDGIYILKTISRDGIFSYKLLKQ